MLLTLSDEAFSPLYLVEAFFPYLPGSPLLHQTRRNSPML